MADYDPYKFDQALAITPDSSVPLRNAVAMVYAPDGTGPLPITQWDGVAMATLTASPQGVYPAFRCQGYTQVIAKSGEFRTELESRYGVLLEVGLEPATVAAAIASADAAAASAQQAIETLQQIIDLGPIGGGSGREVRLRTTSTYIQWQYVGDTAWTNLVALSELQGEPGTSAPGTPGQSPQLRVSGGYVQWKLPNDTTWINLVATSELGGGGGGVGGGGVYTVLWNGTAWVDPVPPSGFQGIRFFNANGYTNVTAYTGGTIAGVYDQYLAPKTAIPAN